LRQADLLIDFDECRIKAVNNIVVEYDELDRIKRMTPDIEPQPDFHSSVVIPDLGRHAEDLPTESLLA
jgi:hypothetical protein